MNLIKTAVRAALFVGALSSVGAFAASPYNVTTFPTNTTPYYGGYPTVPGSAQMSALNDFGQIVQQQNSAELNYNSATVTAAGYGSTGEDYHTSTFSVTGSNGAGTTVVGSVTGYDWSYNTTLTTGTGFFGSIANSRATGFNGNSVGTVAGINNLGQIAGTGYMVGGQADYVPVLQLNGNPNPVNPTTDVTYAPSAAGFTGYQQTGAVRNANGSVTYYGEGTSLSAINNTGAVLGTSATGASFYAAAGSTTEQAITGGGRAYAINDTSQITGKETTGATFTLNHDVVTDWNTGAKTTQILTFDASQAFITAANNGAVSLLNDAGAQQGTGLAVNNLGQVGGYLTYFAQTSQQVTLNSGATETLATYSQQNRAFLTTGHGAVTVGLGVGAATDNTATIFVNNLGEAIVKDSTTGEYYLYAAGMTYAVSSLVAPGTLTAGNYTVTGFNNLGQILISDPYLLTVNTSVSLSGGTAISSTTDYTSTLAAQGYTSTSTAQSATAPMSTIQSYTVPGTAPTIAGAPAGSSVPAPAGWGLLGLGILGLLVSRRKLLAA